MVSLFANNCNALYKFICYEFNEMSNNNNNK